MLRLVSAFCVVLVSASLAFGQGGELGAIQGTITDTSGAVVPGVVIVVTNTATSLERTVISGNNGAFNVPGLSPGKYSVTATMRGFAEFAANALVNVGRTTDVNMKLELAGTREIVNVVEIAPLVETTKTDMGGVVENRDVSNLPLNGRNFSSLATLIPGARPVSAYDPTKSRMGAVSLAGAGGRNINTTVDGMDNKDNTVGGYVQNVSIEGVREFALKTRFSAADGRSAGGMLSIITKSGSNDFHGSLFSFFRDKRLNKNDYISVHSNKVKPEFSRQQYGGSIGGPVKKDRVFAFVTHERLRENASNPIEASITHELQLLKDTGIKIYGLTPVPASIIPTPYRSQLTTGKIDFLLNPRNNAFLSWNESRDRADNDRPSIVDLSSTDSNINRNELFSLALTSTLSPRLVNQFGLGFNYWHNLLGQNPYSPARVNFAGSVTLGTPASVPQESIQRKWQFRDSANWTRGSHQFRFGGDFVYEPSVGGSVGLSGQPTISFFDNPSTILSDKVKYPYGFDTPGIIKEIAASNGDPHFLVTVNMFSAYFQDDWRVSRRLTLNVGVRYDVDLGFFGDQDKNRTYLILKQLNSPLTNSLVNSVVKDDKNNFAPRFGFALDPTGSGRTAIRGGYGMYYDQVIVNTTYGSLTQTYPLIYATSMDLINNNIGKGQLAAFRLGDPIVVPPGLTDLANGASGRLINPDFVSPVSQQFNIGGSRELMKEFVFEIDYTHILNTHENRNLQVNPQRLLADNTNPRVLESAFKAAGMPTNRLGAIAVTSSVNRSRYDGLNFVVRKRLSRGITFNASYTLAKSQAYGGTALYDQFDYLNPRELGPTVQDERHRFVVSSVIDLPWGFQAAPVVQVASARPYSLLAGYDVNKDGVSGDLCVPGTSAPNGRTCPGVVGINSQRGGYDLDGNPVSGRFFLVDMRVSKYLSLSRFREGMNIGFFAEAFNLTNRMNFGNKFDNSARSAFMGSSGLAITTYGSVAASPLQAQIGFRLAF
jgi:hypothetical protein